MITEGGSGTVGVLFPMGTPSIKTPITVGAASDPVLAANDNRTHALIKAAADNTEAFSLAIGEDAVVGKGIVLDPGDSYQIGPMNHTTLVINGISATGGQTASVFEA